MFGFEISHSKLNLYLGSQSLIAQLKVKSSYRIESYIYACREKLHDDKSHTEHEIESDNVDRAESVNFSLYTMGYAWYFQ